ncbi:phosphoglycolate phosphatase [Caenibius tardaugens NBRC 16725]|uniref:phosphoglycolate phosphatase n=1 Tax=Caenibius tardaugens NBRC 16725 TaxID=1219035 RepID=U2Y347_9SPHN|nr:HAD-IA family hydrolase [Caenibius tardaugens]AZI37383.1 HAD family hydrolase [Caenibius tardaugens NBRC 16725]GAD47356.1 phosphoglycolate phosphatase [Caenibius tardaugens NBRC 16725]
MNTVGPKFPFDIIGFDLDGTLVDSSQDLCVALNHALAFAGRDPIPLEGIRPFIGRGVRRMLEQALMIDGELDETRFRPAYKELLSFYQSNLAVHTRLYPGCIAMLDDLAARGCQIAVVTNKFENLGRSLLEQLGLLDRFATVIGGDTMGPGKAKPAPEPILEMINRCGGGKAAFVGDTTIDVGAAQAAEIPCIAVDFGLNDRPADELGATAIISHFDELVPALTRL